MGWSTASKRLFLTRSLSLLLAYLSGFCGAIAVFIHPVILSSLSLILIVLSVRLLIVSKNYAAQVFLSDRHHGSRGVPF